MLMADDQFNLELQQNHLKPSFSNMELLNNIGNAATVVDIENFTSNINNIDNGHMVFSNENYPNHHHDHPHHRHHQLLSMPNFIETNIQTSFRPHDHHHYHLRGGPLYDPITHFLPTSDQGPSHEPDNSRVNSSPKIFNAGFVEETKATRSYGYGGKKRKRNSDQLETEKPREVVHVRARRGQATDSHSLAERLRREKINEKLRCLQDLVPGCYKTMGMAVMLDVIISYVRSLQNQIEFLSMKLSAASLFYDFNSAEMEALDTMQGTNGYEPQVMERMAGEGYGGLPQFHSTWPL